MKYATFGECFFVSCHITIKEHSVFKFPICFTNRTDFVQIESSQKIMKCFPKIEPKENQMLTLGKCSVFVEEVCTGTVEQ